MASIDSALKSALVALTPIFLFSACADMEPTPFPPVQDEVKEGPGLLSGEKGGFVVSREVGGDSKDEQAPVVTQSSQAAGAPPAVGQDPQSAGVIERQSRMLDRQSQMLDRQTREIDRLQEQVEQLKRELEELRSRVR